MPRGIFEGFPGDISERTARGTSNNFGISSVILNRRFRKLPTEVLSDASKYDSWNARTQGNLWTNRPSGSNTSRNTGHEIDFAGRSQHSDSQSLNRTESEKTTGTGGHPRREVRGVRPTRVQDTNLLDRPRPTLPEEVNFCLQWNLNGLYNNLANLELLTHSSQPWVIALQEVNRVDPNRLNRLLGGKYVWTVKVGSNMRHSCAIRIHHSIPFDEINLDSDLPITAVRLKGKLKITIVNAYLPGGTLPNMERKVTNVLEGIPGPKVFLGDLNAHHPAWGDERTDARGAALMRVCENLDLMVMNDGSGTFFNGYVSSAIDVTAVSREQAGRFRWTISSDLSGSDHYPIRITANAGGFRP